MATDELNDPGHTDPDRTGPDHTSKDLSSRTPVPGPPPPAGAPPPADVPAGEPPPAEPPPKRSRAGRNLPAAIGVGVGLGALAIVSLFTVKWTFLIYMAAVVGLALWELGRALRERDIRLPEPPIAVGGALMLALAYTNGTRPLVAALAVTVIGMLAWRMPGGSAGYLRDISAGLFALAWLPLMASFVGLMLAAPDGARRVLAFLILPVCSDVGGYAVGVLAGRHPMAPVISPSKTWEGLAGSVAACAVAGVLVLTLLLHGTWWQGIVLGVAAGAAATLGDLSESMIKRDLQIKDMGRVLPGHGGILDRIDSLLITAPVVWLLLTIFLN